MKRVVPLLILSTGWPWGCRGDDSAAFDRDPEVPSGDVASGEIVEIPPFPDPQGVLEDVLEDSVGPTPSREPVLLLEARIPDDLGLFECDRRLPVDPTGGFLRPLRVSPCGTMAWVFRNLRPRPDGTWDYSLVLQQATPWDGAPGPRWYFAGAVARTDPPPIAAWITFSEGTCEPRVWRLADQEPRLIQWVPRPDGTVAPAPVLWDLGTPLGAEPSRLDPVAFGEDRQGGLDLLVRADLGALGTPLVHLRLLDRAWTVTRVPPAPFLDDLGHASFAFGADGSLHVAVAQEDGILWAVLENRSWRIETALPGTRGTEGLDMVHLALGSYDIPLMAHRHTESIESGLWQSLRLDLVFRPSGSSWTRETVTDRNGTWRSDTDRWTGVAPRIFTTPSGRWWVSWLDLARLSSVSENVGSAGGPRLAIRRETGWMVREMLPRSPSRFPPSRFDVAQAVAADLDPRLRFYGALVLERERLGDVPRGLPGEASWRLWLVREAL